MHWKTVQRRKGSRGKRSRSSEDDLARVASSLEASEHFTPVKPRERACEVEAFPLSLSPSSSRSLERNLPFYLSFFRLSLSLLLSIYLFLCTPFNLHTVSLSGLHRTRASLLECTLLCGKDRFAATSIDWQIFLKSEKMNDKVRDKSNKNRFEKIFKI